MLVKVNASKILSNGTLTGLMLLLTAIGFLSCNTTIQKVPTLFDELDSNATQITFANTLT